MKIIILSFNYSVNIVFCDKINKSKEGGCDKCEM